MRGDGDVAVDVRDDEVAVLVPAPQLRRVELGDGLLVEDVRVRDAVDAADAGEAGVVAVLVHVRRVDGECRLREILGELPRQHHPELGRVLRAADAGDGVVEEPPVDCGEPTGLGVGAAAAADEGVDRGGVDPLVAEHVEDDAAAEVELVVDVRELEELRRVVEEAVLEARGLVLEEADLGRGGPGVDD